MNTFTAVMIWLWRQLWTAVWECSELTGIGLGHAAPWVFAQMTGYKGKRIE